MVKTLAKKAGEIILEIFLFISFSIIGAIFITVEFLMKLLLPEMEPIPSAKDQEASRPKYSEESLWGTYDGRLIKIKDLDDGHLSNIIKHMNTYPSNYSPLLLKVMMEQSQKRGLSPDFLNKDYVFYKDGIAMVWDFQKHEPVPVTLMGNNYGNKTSH